MTQFKWWAQTTLIQRRDRIALLVRKLHLEWTVGVALVSAILSASWVGTTWSTGWPYVQRYMYRSRHATHVISYSYHVPAAVLTEEMYWDRVKRATVTAMDFRYQSPRPRRSWRNRWAKAWSAEQEAAFIRFSTDSSC